jgi:hypothetical protein
MADQDFFEELEGDPGVDFSSTARRLVDPIANERQAALARAAQLEQLLTYHEPAAES